MKRRRIKEGLRIVSVLLLGALLAGCMPFSLLNTSDDESGDTTQVPITPVQSVDSQRQSYTLYFRYNDEAYLVGEQRMLSAGENQRIEKALLQEMIKNGPSAGSVNLEPVVNPGTNVVSVSENREYLYVTLSREFLDPISSEVPDDWEGDPDWRAVVYEERRLAVMAIVNTLTELGEYSRVQILIDTDNTGKGERPTRQMLGFVSDDEAQNAQLMEPIARDQSMVLTPGNTLDLMLKRFGEKDWTAVDSLIAQTDQRGGYTKPATEEVVNMLALMDISLTSYEIHTETVSNDGQSAVVTVSYSFQLKNGSTFSNEDVSMRMVRENNLWKLVYPSINQLLNNT